MPVRAAIDLHFSQPDIGRVVGSLRAATTHPEWRGRALAALEKRSPTMLSVTLEQINRGQAMNLADALRMELGMIQGAFDHGDFIEGIRALIIDKDNTPKWNPARIDKVKPAVVARFFEQRWTDKPHPLSHLQ